MVGVRTLARALALSVVLAACSTPPSASAVEPSSDVEASPLPERLGPTGVPPKRPEISGHRRIFTVRWPQAKLRRWRAALRDRPAVVAFDGQAVELVEDCELADVRPYVFVSEAPVEYELRIEQPEVFEAMAISTADRRDRALEIMVVPSGTLAATPETPTGDEFVVSGSCEGATHWVSAARLGSWVVGWSGQSHEVRTMRGESLWCDVWPASTQAPADCDAVVLIELIPLVPDSTSGPSPCPDSAPWNGWSCSPDEQPAASVTCLVAVPEHPGCRAFPRGRDWSQAEAFPPAREPGADQAW